MKKNYIALIFLIASMASNAQNCIASNPNRNISTTSPCAGQVVTLTCSGGALTSPLQGQGWVWASYSNANCMQNNYTNYLGTIAGPNANIASISGATVLITQPITYIGLAAMNGACGTNIPCSGSIFTITRQNGPAITLPSGVKYFCPGTATSISATVSGSPISHAWYKGSTAIVGATTTVLSFPNPTIGDAGTFKLVSTNACGTSTSSIVTFTTLSNQTVSGTAITLTNSTTGYSIPNASGVNYSWSLPAGGGTVTTGASTWSAGINWGNTTGVYTVQVLKTLGTCSVTDTKTVSVEACNTTTVSITNITSGNAIICPSSSVILVASANGSFTWSTNQNGTTINVSPTITTTYSVQSRDLLGCPKSGTIQVLVSTLPQLTISSSNSIVCSGETTTITASGANTYTWTGINNNSSIIVTPAVSTTYYLTGANSDFCTSNSQISITVSNCTGILEFDNSKFSVYPNPAENYIIVESQEILYYEIFSSLGVKVAYGSVDGKQTQIDILNLSKGVYILQLNDGRTKGVKRIIKE